MWEHCYKTSIGYVHIDYVHIDYVHIDYVHIGYLDVRCNWIMFPNNVNYKDNVFVYII